MINKKEQYTEDRYNAAIGTAKTFLSNFDQLITPIEDEAGNKYWNSEAYYMALRTDSAAIRKAIALSSIQGGTASRQARKKYALELDEEKRAAYMQQAVNKKFDANPDLRARLLSITREIIEKNYWKDDLFGVREDTLQGANVLGKCLMNYITANRV